MHPLSNLSTLSLKTKSSIFKLQTTKSTFTLDSFFLMELAWSTQIENNTHYQVEEMVMYRESLWIWLHWPTVKGTVGLRIIIMKGPNAAIFPALHCMQRLHIIEVANCLVAVVWLLFCEHNNFLANVKTTVLYSATCMALFAIQLQRGGLYSMQAPETPRCISVGAHEAASSGRKISEY